MIVSLAAALLFTSLMIDPVQAPDATAVSKPAREKKICHVENIMGSRKPQKTCRTVKEWEVEKKAADNEAEARR
jgi:hypothetical protein